jgi:hypothetical protein
MQPCPQPNGISINVLFMRVLTHDEIEQLIVVSVRSAMVSQSYVGPTSKRWFLKIVQVTIKHDAFDAM